MQHVGALFDLQRGGVASAPDATMLAAVPQAGHTRTAHGAAFQEALPMHTGDSQKLQPCLLLRECWPLIVRTSCPHLRISASDDGTHVARSDRRLSS